MNERNLIDKAEIKTIVDEIYNCSNLKDWKRCRLYFTDEIETDFESLSGEKAAKIPADDLVGAMKALKAKIFIGGDHNDIKSEHLVEMHSLIPKSQLAIFPNTKHIVLLTNPDNNKVLPQIKEFLNGE